MAEEFKDLKVFEDEKVNKTIDSIYSLLEDNFGPIGNKFAVCGSVAKILDGKFSEDYKAKDIDLLCRCPFLWRFLTANYTKFKTITSEKESFRIKLFFDGGFLVEIWNEKLPFSVEGIYKDKIHYCYAD